MKNDALKVNCPTCQKALLWDSHNPFRPFCSKRCQLIDLGEWANEEKRIPSDTEQSDDDHWSETDLSH